MTVQEFVNIDKDLQTVQDISDVNIIYWNGMQLVQYWNKQKENIN
jgi:hypothetical protein